MRVELLHSMCSMRSIVRLWTPSSKTRDSRTHVSCLGRRSLLQTASKLHDQHHHPQVRSVHSKDQHIKRSNNELGAGYQTLTQAWATEL